MGKVNKTIRLLGEVVALTTEKTLKVGSKILTKMSKEKENNSKAIKIYKFSDELSDKIIKETKILGEFCEEVSKEAFKSETKIYGDTEYIYDKETIVKSDFTIED